MSNKTSPRASAKPVQPRPAKRPPGRDRSRDLTHRGPAVRTDWASLIQDEQWHTYRAAIEAVREAGIRFMIGGAFGLACYTGRWRNTKDVDFYLHPHDRERAIAALSGAGFRDYFTELPYDRRWIYRSTREGFIVDLIWAMANQRAELSADWFHHAPTVTVRGERLQSLPAEVLLWCKLYILQRDRCDWPDLINILYAVGPQLDWARLLAWVGEDRSVLAGLLHVFQWACPDAAATLPAPAQALLQTTEPRAQGPDKQRRRIQILDSRPWFAADQPVDQPMKL